MQIVFGELAVVFIGLSILTCIGAGAAVVVRAVMTKEYGVAVAIGVLWLFLVGCVFGLLANRGGV